MSTNATMQDSSFVPESELSDLDLLSQALQEAMDAQGKGVLGGPGLDEVALRRAERRARRQDASRLLSTRVSVEGAIA